MTGALDGLILHIRKLRLVGQFGPTTLNQCIRDSNFLYPILTKEISTFNIYFSMNNTLFLSC